MLSSGDAARHMPGADGVSHAASQPQQDVTIPDSEESPGRCTQQRQPDQCHPQPLAIHNSSAAMPGMTAAESFSAQLACNGGTAVTGAVQCTGGAFLSSVASATAAAAGSLFASDKVLELAQHQGCRQQPEPASSGCSLEALPRHSPPEVCTQHSSEQQHHRQQQAHSWGGSPSRQGQLQLSHQQLGEGIPPAFGTPIAPAPAGPSEHLGDDPVPSNVRGSPVPAVAQPGDRPVPVAGSRRQLTDTEQDVIKTRLLEGSQPSSSSLKRVPETPDSAENRSQPTQSPCGEHWSNCTDLSAGQTAA